MAAMKLKAVEHTLLSINDKLTFCLKKWTIVLLYISRAVVCRVDRIQFQMKLS